jgi:hypothetical protein
VASRRKTPAFGLMLFVFLAFSLDSASANGERVRVPRPDGGAAYLTLNPGEVIDLSRGPVRFGPHPVLLQRVGAGWESRAVASGHTQVAVGSGAHAHTLVVFVTPTPSRQVGRRDLEW